MAPLAYISLVCTRGYIYGMCAGIIANHVSHPPGLGTDIQTPSPQPCFLTTPGCSGYTLEQKTSITDLRTCTSSPTLIAATHKVALHDLPQSPPRHGSLKLSDERACRLETQLQQQHAKRRKEAYRGLLTETADVNTAASLRLNQFLGSCPPPRSSYSP